MISSTRIAILAWIFRCDIGIRYCRLTERSQAMSLFGPPNVEKMKARRDINGLIEALKYQQGSPVDAKNIRRDAARALGELGDRRAVEPLIAALGDSDFQVRMYSAESLGKIGDPRAVQSLTRSLLDGSSIVRAVAAETLGKFGDAGAAASLVATLVSESDKVVCLNIAVALDKLGWKPDAHDKSAAWYFIAKDEWKKCVEIDLPAVEPLIAIIEDVRWIHKSFNAAWALGMIGDVRAVKPLINALRTARDERVRFAAAEALGQIGNLRGVNPLIAALEDDEWAVRKTAAEALISIYRRGGMDEKMKIKILAQRDKIAAMHNDEHTDKSDCDRHGDFNVGGIEFLL
jgi:HEAT repeat protein